MRFTFKVLLTATVVLTLAERAAPQWAFETVDTESNSGPSSSLQFDLADRPHISYNICDANRDWYLKYASHDGTSWSIEVVAPPGTSPYNEGFYNCLKLDSNERPHIVHAFAGGGDELKYAAWNGTQWEFQVLDTLTREGWDCYLALDAEDNPCISYVEGETTNEALEFARWNGTSWDMETVDDNGDCGWNSCLALDSLGRPHIVYVAADTSELRYARRNDSSWDIYPVDQACVDTWGNCSIVIGPDDRPSISYYTADYADVKYGVWNGSGFDIQVIPKQYPCGLIALALEADGTPHIAYGAPELRYATWDGSDWIVESVAPAATGDRVSLALDSLGNPWISYGDKSGGGMRLTLAHRLPVPGDTQPDGCVDGLDYNQWSVNYLAQPVPAWSAGGWSVGNFNEDDVVDGLDYNIWSIHYLEGCAGAEVPEPACVVLILSGAWVMLKRGSSR